MAFGRTHEEFWSLSPAQIVFTLQAHTATQQPQKRRGTAKDAMTAFGAVAKKVAGAPQHKPGRGP